MTGESSYARNYYYQLALAVHMHITCYAHVVLLLCACVPGGPQAQWSVTIDTEAPED